MQENNKTQLEQNEGKKLDLEKMFPKKCLLCDCNKEEMRFQGYKKKEGKVLWKCNKGHVFATDFEDLTKKKSKLYQFSYQELIDALYNKAMNDSQMNSTIQAEIRKIRVWLKDY